MVFSLFSDKLQKLIKEKGFIEPTLPQKLGIPEILSGKNTSSVLPITGMVAAKSSSDFKGFFAAFSLIFRVLSL